MEERFLNGAFLVYFIAFLFTAVSTIFKKEKFWGFAKAALLAGLLLHTANLYTRWLSSGYPPFSNLYESMSFFAWILALLYLILTVKSSIPMVNIAVTLFILLLCAYTSFLDSTARPLMPALQSNWLTVHVVTCFIGYAAFAISFLCSIFYLFKAKGGKIANKLEEFSYRNILLGFLFLTLGIITGSVWANNAWGTYWSWDPKETWSLVTWLIYAFYLHMRFVRGLKGRKAAYLSIIGFGAVVFTYLGVSYLLSGLHSYVG